jgi:hypothetical protein
MLHADLCVFEEEKTQISVFRRRKKRKNFESVAFSSPEALAISHLRESGHKYTHSKARGKLTSKCGNYLI